MDRIPLAFLWAIIQDIAWSRSTDPQVGLTLRAIVLLLTGSLPLYTWSTYNTEAQGCCLPFPSFPNLIMTIWSTVLILINIMRLLCLVVLSFIQIYTEHLLCDKHSSRSLLSWGETDYKTPNTQVERVDKCREDKQVRITVQRVPRKDAFWYRVVRKVFSGKQWLPFLPEVRVSLAHWKNDREDLMPVAEGTRQRSEK